MIPSPDQSANMKCTSGQFRTEGGGAYPQCVTGQSQSGTHSGVSCAAPSTVANGQWSFSPFTSKTDNGGYAVGTIVPLQCSQGFTPSVTNPSITCDNLMGNGQWVGTGTSVTCKSSGGSVNPSTPPPPPSSSGGNPPPPPAQAGSCSKPTAVLNGKWSQPPFGSFATGMTAIMTCDAGYIPSPDAAANMICGQNGQWGFANGASLSYVSCTKGQSQEGTHTGVSCATPYPPVGGTWAFSPFATKVGNGYGVNSIGALKCNVGGTASVADASITCDNVMGHGQWVGNGLNARCQ